MKGIFVIWACFALVFQAFIFHTVEAQGFVEATTFCTPGETRACPNIGICTGRFKVCENGKWSEECTGGVSPQQEICNNNLDDDCNGMVDDCESIFQPIGIFLIIGGFILLIFAFALSRVFK
ncbi:MAG: hypothetical protein QW286_01840 [Candidatus Aenigmatarchaeota archaeon]